MFIELFVVKKEFAKHRNQMNMKAVLHLMYSIINYSDYLLKQSLYLTIMLKNDSNLEEDC